MPVFSRAQVERICSLCGASLPPALLLIMDKYGHQKESMEEAGLEYASQQIGDLLQHGIEGIHLYTLNKTTSSPRVVRLLRERGFFPL